MVQIAPFRATVAEIGGRVALISVSGELDVYVEKDLRDALAAGAKLDSPAVVVDLSAVSFMDSTVCGILLAEAKTLRRKGADLVLVSNRNRAGRVLEVGGIDEVIRVYPTLHGAFQELLGGVAT